MGDELTLEDIKRDKTYIEMIKMVDRLGGRLVSGNKVCTI